MNPSSISLHHHHPITTHLPTQNPLPTGTNLSFFLIKMSLTENAPSLAIAGLTGVVGQEFLPVLSDKNFPYRSLKIFASKRSAGKQITFEEKTYTVEELTENSFKDVDIALFRASGSISKKIGPIVVENGLL